MAIDFKSTEYNGNLPTFWRGEAKVLPGGYKPSAIAFGSIVRKGQLVNISADSLTVNLCKSAKCLTAEASLKVDVPRDAHFAVGDYVCVAGDSSTTPTTIEAIDTTKGNVVTLTLKTTLSLTKDAVLIETTSATTKGTPKYEPNGVVVEDVDSTTGITTLDIAYDAVLLKSFAPQPIISAWLNGITLKGNPNILVVQQ